MVDLENKEVVFVDENLEQVCCDGKSSGSTESGHPKTCYRFRNNDQAVCYYCSKVFVKKKRIAAA